MASWSKQHVLELIEMYKSFECLWKMKSQDYNNRELKDQAYQYMIERVAQFDPESSRDYITKKINNLRGAFRKEAKKVRCRPNYRPKLWYFHHLSFITEDQDEELTDDCDNSSSRKFMLAIKNEHVSADEEDSWSDAEESEAVQHEYENGIGNTESLDSPNASSSEPKSKRLKFDDIKTFNLCNSQGHIGQSTLKTLKDKEYFNVIGLGIANKLKRLERTQRIFAERLIHEVIFEGEMGALNRNISLTGFIETDDHEND